MTSAIRVPIADASVVVAGVARDCGKSIAATLEALRNASVGFRRADFAIVESDSTDETRQELNRLASEMDLSFECLGRLADTIPARTQRIAHARNRMVELVREKYPDNDYVIVADLDGVNDNVTKAGIESAWSSIEPWDVVTANQPGRYYDIWALRHASWSPNDCWQAARELEPVFGRNQARRLAVWSRQANLPTHAPLLEVDSAFGGLAIYRSDAFFSGQYSGINDGLEVCEHVPFHECIRAAGFRIFINPALLNRPQAEHEERFSPLKQGMSRFWRMISQRHISTTEAASTSR